MAVSADVPQRRRTHNFTRYAVPLSNRQGSSENRSSAKTSPGGSSATVPSLVMPALGGMARLCRLIQLICDDLHAVFMRSLIALAANFFRSISDISAPISCQASNQYAILSKSLIHLDHQFLPLITCTLTIKRSNSSTFNSSSSPSSSSGSLDGP